MHTAAERYDERRNALIEALAVRAWNARSQRFQRVGLGPDESARSARCSRRVSRRAGRLVPHPQRTGLRITTATLEPTSPSAIARRGGRRVHRHDDSGTGWT